MDVSQYYETVGQGEPVFFIHGSYASTSTWRKMVERVSLTHQCILFKLPGHCGLPDPPDFDNPTIETELSLIEAVVNEFAGLTGFESSNSPGIHLVGHSYGGVVALALALKGSIKLRKLTLYEPVATWLVDLAEDDQLMAAVELFLKPYRRDVAVGVPFAGGQVIDFWCDSPEFKKFPDKVKDQLMLLQQNNIRHWDICTRVSHNVEDIKGLEVPTHLVVGENSSLVAHGIIDLLAGWLPNGERYLIPGANHFLVTSHIDACLAAM